MGISVDDPLTVRKHQYVHHILVNFGAQSYSAHMKKGELPRSSDKSELNRLRRLRDRDANYLVYARFLPILVVPVLAVIRSRNLSLPLLIALTGPIFLLEIYVFYRIWRGFRRRNLALGAALSRGCRGALDPTDQSTLRSLERKSKRKHRWIPLLVTGVFALSFLYLAGAFLSDLLIGHQFPVATDLLALAIFVPLLAMTVMAYVLLFVLRKDEEMLLHRAEKPGIVPRKPAGVP